MAYNKPPVKPVDSKKTQYAGQTQANKLTGAEQQGKTGIPESSDAFPDLGTNPSSGNFEPNAGSSATAHKGAGPAHVAVATPDKPASKGGAKVGSVHTLTKLIFHPKGGMGHAGRKAAKSSPGYKDSGERGGTKATGVSK